MGIRLPAGAVSLCAPDAIPLVLLIRLIVGMRHLSDVHHCGRLYNTSSSSSSSSHTMPIPTRVSLSRPASGGGHSYTATYVLPSHPITSARGRTRGRGWGLSHHIYANDISRQRRQSGPWGRVCGNPITSHLMISASRGGSRGRTRHALKVVVWCVFRQPRTL